jgi:hypothetical protein
MMFRSSLIRATMSEPDDFGAELPNQLTVSAIAMHSMFTAMLAAGFTERQALYLVAVMTSLGGSGKP